MIKKLVRDGFIKKNGRTVELQKNAKTMLLKKISQKWNLINLLHCSNELVLSYLTELLTLNEILTNTGLSTATIYRAISDFKAIGIIQKKTDPQGNYRHGRTPERMRIDPSKTELVDLARILKTERESMYDPDAEIIYSEKEKTIKKVIREK